jgi:hypothetical protein
VVGTIERGAMTAATTGGYIVGKKLPERLGQKEF